MTSIDTVPARLTTMDSTAIPAAASETSHGPRPGRSRPVGLRQLPGELSADPGYQHAVVISCPSNQTGDTASTA